MHSTTFSIFSETSKQSPPHKPPDLSRSRLPKLDPKPPNAHSLFLTAKSTTRDFRTPPVSDKILSSKHQTSFSWKKTGGVHKSHFLDDKVLTDKLILDLNPGKITSKRHLLLETSGEEEGKVRGFILKKERKKTMDLGLVNINDSVSENYMKSIMNFNERGSEMIHCEEYGKII